MNDFGEHIRQADEALPLLAEVDAAVVGGSFAGLAAAFALAAKGRRVLVAEPRTYLGAEATATLRPWIARDLEGAGLPDWAAGAIRSAVIATEAAGDELPLQPDRLKAALEDALLRAGVRFLYGCLPVGVAVAPSGGAVEGVVLAAKSGRYVVSCHMLVDASETGVVSALLGEPLPSGPEEAVYARTLEFDGVAADVPRELPLPAPLGVEGGAARVRVGCRGEGHAYVEFALRLPADNTLEASRARERAAREAGMAIASYLIRETPAFAKANFAASSHELAGPLPLPGAAVEVDAVSAEPFRTSLAGVWRLAGGGLPAFGSPVAAARFGASAAAAIAAAEAGSAGVAEALAARPCAEGVEARSIPRDARDEAARPRRRVRTALSSYPVWRRVAVAVVGGGSSGASASIFAAQEGVSTALVEGNPGMGGTGTYGGVDSYWFGRRVGFAAHITACVDRVHESLRYKGHKWNVEAKTYALEQEAYRSGTEPLFNAITFAAATEGNVVRGVVAATRWGPVALVADAVVDATGDGDVAVFAGADSVYGSATDGTVMWYSLAQFREPGRTKNNFTSMVDLRDPGDATRAIVTGRRRGESVHDHGIYVATRESRHIVGGVTMTLADQLLQRRWDDVVNIHFSNHDVKGLSGADWVHIGLIPPNLEIEIPYRMLLPRGVEGLLVVGKAISATHDALPAIRMQSDLENLGAVAAWAAATAAKAGAAPSAIDVKALQARLVARGLLPEDVLTRRLAPVVYDDAALAALVDRIEDRPLYEYAEMRMNEVYRERLPFAEICSVGPRVVPYLERALADAPDGLRRRHLALALAMYGSASALPYLRGELSRAFAGNELPRRTADMMYVQLPPDHGAMSDAAYLLYALALVPDAGNAAVWERVAALLRRYGDEDFKDMMLALFYYVDAVAKGAARLGDAAAVPALRGLHAHPSLRGLATKSIVQPDYFLERRAMLELAIGGALARCGAREGYDILIDYLDDARSLLRKQAARELADVAEAEGASAPATPAAWRVWLEQRAPALRPKAQKKRLDLMEESGMINR
ncbi:FAD-dependent oxidoreductase [Paenibacillus sp.]|uniref:FAD-dependent oxidoreductase n=1 Tax=Paenibacillus sp. TaxID=58172 RepID=UPI002D56444D|nr:FAD-dependent oxidoreductase [Paenibacillus sp.]HZG54871.1 FAD-dependent oxidoreductase [Paenibacillus sp.]